MEEKSSLGDGKKSVCFGQVLELKSGCYRGC